MAEKSKGKRSLEEDDSNPTPMQKKPRFPKGKKVKSVDRPQVEPEEAEGTIGAAVDPRIAAKERAKRRTQMKEEELLRSHADFSAAEVHYDDSANFEEDGIQIEPFNLKQEREEGYFDADGNYVEYAIQSEIKDAWLDNVVVDLSYAEKHHKKTEADEEYHDISTEDIGKIKRSIANVLQPGETIIQALKRLKGTSVDERGRMSEGTKRIFDKLTEDAMKLMENGEYNVYNEEKEIFEREAEGYERIARARAGTFATADNGSRHGEDIFADGMGDGAGTSLDQSEAKTSLQVSSSDGGDQFDMFGDDEDNTNQPVSENLNPSQDLYYGEATGGMESDFVYDQSSGYYYSSSLGYYYDPASTLYCCATTGKWYSYNDESGEYVECQNGADAES
ncbi:CD2 antigen cytoplasmic tail-binding protein 2-like protein [Iris pallida]|uniref:CD2 antigen cytoplasmic tail-binding protein 2-like protein n=1 Tax=Iris pallida TaxID=29817 RepID=A0AAX6GIH1_IRIPA|nr:CD2 antigen cytoplasmic tail-binding protein 2-like protein [Iris pallida]